MSLARRSRRAFGGVSPLWHCDECPWGRIGCAEGIVNEQTRSAIREFQELLTTRFNRGVHTTEDGVRYTFFAALMRAGFSPDEIALEFPHTATKGKEIDTVIVDEAGLPAAAIEFKYDRAIPSARQPSTDESRTDFQGSDSPVRSLWSMRSVFRVRDGLDNGELFQKSTETTI